MQTASSAAVQPRVQPRTRRCAHERELNAAREGARVEANRGVATVQASAQFAAQTTTLATYARSDSTPKAR